MCIVMTAHNTHDSFPSSFCSVHITICVLEMLKHAQDCDGIRMFWRPRVPEFRALTSQWIFPMEEARGPPWAFCRGAWWLMEAKERLRVEVV